MYQVLFAEDELLVRLGLQNSIDWKAYDMELAAQADNGLQAYELFQKVRPDVVITDIRMEGMDGCELIEKIRQQDKECAIIVISCLDDFEILRRMIPYKIIGYILKASMTMDEVNEILAKTTEYLKKIGREGRKSGKESLSPEKMLSEYHTVCQAGYLCGSKKLLWQIFVAGRCLLLKRQRSGQELLAMCRRTAL